MVALAVAVEMVRLLWVVVVVVVVPQRTVGAAVAAAVVVVVVREGWLPRSYQRWLREPPPVA